MSPGEKLDPLPDTFILQPPVFHPVIPYVTTIFGGLRAGKMVMLQGVVPLNARRFMVDFQCGCSLHPRPDIAIHFNPRFHTTKPHVICNTLYRGCWQAEARHSWRVAASIRLDTRCPARMPFPRVSGLDSLRDEAAHVPVTLRASFADRTLAWVSRWGRKKLILAPFLFYPQRFFEVLLLCQEGGLKLALNGQGVGATSLGQQVLEQLRELRISGSVQLYCVHY
ncbi:hypothetical protein Celaphus_00013426 [Cervus elaphus hippelaphus]|uniref:Galectin n=1 Tax=Cervus elaphus hippelaphus TaxID=46360 RepID=A0A212DGA3_CEREH|nr:hypothetical protein Celaphus_00013426 [Cervus elaphus hippelaphus]